MINTFLTQAWLGSVDTLVVLRFPRNVIGSGDTGSC